MIIVFSREENQDAEEAIGAKKDVRWEENIRVRRLLRIVTETTGTGTEIETKTETETETEAEIVIAIAEHLKWIRKIVKNN